jgi:superfamily I DNA/RNA helicase
MMTIHGAKGLEFHYVFIVGLGNISFFLFMKVFRISGHEFEGKIFFPHRL